MEESQRDKKKYRLHLRTHIAFSSIITLCLACIVSCGIILLGTRLLYHGPLTIFLLIVLCLLVCTLSMVIGGSLLFFVTGHLSKPIEALSKTVNMIAKGDFSARVERKEQRNDKFEYANELDELEANVNKMAMELNGMDYMRKDFMSNVSHEVKTPLAAITGFSEILMDGKLDKQEQEEYLQLINNESRRLSVLCENMLQMSRLDYQEIVAKKNKVRIDEQIRKCIILLTQKWYEMDISFDLEMDAVTVESDASLLMQLWTNLIDNAIKYSDMKPYIKIRVKKEDRQLLVRIEDDGIGIPKEKLPKIYDKFYQCDESHKKHGNGLGLSIVKRILELLHGTISYESEEDEGTVVFVTIPIDLKS